LLIVGTKRTSCGAFRASGGDEVKPKHLARIVERYCSGKRITAAREMLRLHFVALSMTFYFALNNQQPTTNNQQPTTNNQQPTTNNQQPA
jgi:hypothetical protein